MRTDERGEPCPATLGEYRDLVAAFEGENGEATAFLDEKIARYGRDMAVLAPDYQMRALLLPMIRRTAERRLQIEPLEPRVSPAWTSTFD